MGTVHKLIHISVGVVYRVDDLTDGIFYIGETISEETWNRGYIDSGTLWSRHINKYKEHKYGRIILLEAKTPKELYDREVEEIKKYTKINDNGKLVVDHSTGCMNIDVGLHDSNIITCPVCGGIDGQHSDGCEEMAFCPECGVRKTKGHAVCCSLNPNIRKKRKKEQGNSSVERKGNDIVRTNIEYKCVNKNDKINYKKPCSCEQQKQQKKDAAPRDKEGKCLECGAKSGRHFKSCSFYKEHKPCPECGSTARHKSWCSKSTLTVKPCDICGGIDGKHKKDCPKYNRKTKHVLSAVA